MYMCCNYFVVVCVTSFLWLFVDRSHVHVNSINYYYCVVLLLFVVNNFVFQVLSVVIILSRVWLLFC